MRPLRVGPELQAVAWLAEVRGLELAQVAELVPGWEPLRQPP